MCDKVDGGVVCGRPHNYLLHGTTSKFSCCVSMMRVEVASSHSSRLEPAEVLKEDAEAGEPPDRLEVEESRPSSAAAKDESLRELLSSTEVKIDAILSDLSALEDVEKMRAEFWTVLCRLRQAQDEQKNSGKKEEELGDLSIRKFKQMAMTKFANSVEQLNSKVPSCPPDLKAEVEEDCLIRPEEKQCEDAANIVEEELKLDAKEESLIKLKEEQYDGVASIVDKKLEMEEEEMSYKEVEVLICATKAEAADTTLPRLKEVEGSSKIHYDERGPEEEKQEATVIMIDKEEVSLPDLEVKVVKHHPPDEGLMRREDDDFRPCSSYGTSALKLAPLDAGD